MAREARLCGKPCTPRKRFNLVRIQKENVTLADDAPSRPRKVREAEPEMLQAYARKTNRQEVCGYPGGGACTLEVWILRSFLALCRRDVRSIANRR